MKRERERDREFCEVKTLGSTYIAPSVSMKGEMFFDGVVRIAGQLEGKIYFKNPRDRLIIEREGIIRGTIQGFDIEIFGRMDGEIKSQGRVILRPSAIVRGKISALSLVIYPGSQLDIESVNCKQ
ncbi:MAG: polymer-forming cytoskeletal protein [Oligoflexia bacterium]|nr:polymer-forming cytoskeletal protein [Oligoflexia bacterium]MBF0365279.1 polymer-forming cytoskeletal protein [Oligoflexia bacterium]